MNNQEKNNSKLQNTILFINTTQKIIDEEGIENVSIRKIAERAKLHNSTIYLYFKDLDQLIMLASMKYFRNYSQMLGELSKNKGSVVDNFINIWTLFTDSVLQYPKVFFNFFFGKHSDNLQDIMNLYYDVFPEERDEFSDDIESMYFGKNILERSLKILKPLLNEDTLVTSDNLTMINEIMVSYCKYKLELKCMDETLDSIKIKNDVMNMIKYVTGIN